MPYVPYRNIDLFIHLFMSEITCSTVPSNEVYRTIVKEFLHVSQHFRFIIIVYDKDPIYLHILF